MGAELLIAVDQEGGPVTRIEEGVPALPAAREVGLTQTPEEAGATAKETAAALLALGVNTNLAPVADVVKDPDHFLYERSYSGDAVQVAKFVEAVVTGYRESGLICAIKHFPGHGAGAGDTHEGSAAANVTPEEWRRTHLPPFAAAVAAGAPLVMTAHLTAPAFDPENPASQSTAVIEDLLRRELGFEGVVITDDLSMAAAGADPGEAAVRSLVAGADLLILSATGSTPRAVQIDISEAVQSGRLSRARLAEAVQRVLELKREFGLY
ncbi:MAG: hypothetical protein Kow00129_00110 [Thermoleophilia bacterium]